LKPYCVSRIGFLPGTVYAELLAMMLVTAANSMGALAVLKDPPYLSTKSPVKKNLKLESSCADDAGG
jgi:hypothetical protein